MEFGKPSKPPAAELPPPDAPSGKSNGVKDSSQLASSCEPEELAKFLLSKPALPRNGVPVTAALQQPVRVFGHGVANKMLKGVRAVPPKADAAGVAGGVEEGKAKEDADKKVALAADDGGRGEDVSVTLAALVPSFLSYAALRESVPCISPLDAAVVTAGGDGKTKEDDSAKKDEPPGVADAPKALPRVVSVGLSAMFKLLTKLSGSRPSDCLEALELVATVLAGFGMQVGSCAGAAGCCCRGGGCFYCFVFAAFGLVSPSS